MTKDLYHRRDNIRRVTVPGCDGCRIWGNHACQLGRYLRLSQAMTSIEPSMRSPQALVRKAPVAK